MKFGEKVKKSRTDAGLSQEDLAKKIGVSLRTITNYEVQNRYPKKREVYAKLAEVLGVDINYLMTEDEDFVVDASAKYGARGAKQAEQLISEVHGLFAGGELSEADKDGVMKALQQAYWECKEENVQKYTPKKYKK
ncbi:helix-turn-helix domain-containing protein [Caproicibacterium sp. BJN0003]|jgi:transcriptional regulator with XRE-family HTH domain|uniref:helix-turn-helix domain-containing protein n=1 Tax=Caproicibacterium sp. BJN0003 TaxID=2994078 RepID=UPI00225677CF|nr:helix-turn-helix transcriptional regulator [Caproicibacterium sp. BJN0003]UZT82388.1 helix-turn-helix transcriptional regulator [Caproicibacterium sp. BJN0003]